MIALLVTANIVWTGWQLMQRSAAGLMDISLPTERLEEIETLLTGYRLLGLVSMPCALVRPAAAPSLPCTCWCPVSMIDQGHDRPLV